MLTNRSFKTVALTALIIVYGLSARAGAADDSSLNARLAVLSRQMAAAGNENFLLAEALHDSLLQVEQPYNFVIDDGHYTVNGRPIPGALTAKYNSLLEMYYAADTKNRRSAYRSLRGTGIHTAALFDPASSFRKGAQPVAAATTPAAGADYSDAIIGEMRKDGLISGAFVTISYHASGIVVNGKRLDPEPEKHYQQRFAALGAPTPTGDSDGIVITQNR